MILSRPRVPETAPSDGVVLSFPLGNPSVCKLLLCGYPGRRIDPAQGLKPHPLTHSIPASSGPVPATQNDGAKLPPQRHRVCKGDNQNAVRYRGVGDEPREGFWSCGELNKAEESHQ